MRGDGHVILRRHGLPPFPAAAILTAMQLGLRGAVLLLAPGVPAQGSEWLREIARIPFPAERMIAADITADGSQLVTITDGREVTVAKGALRHFRIPGDETITAAAIDASRSTVTVFLERDGTRLTRVHRLPPRGRAA